MDFFLLKKNNAFSSPKSLLTPAFSLALKFRISSRNDAHCALALSSGSFISVQPGIAICILRSQKAIDRGRTEKRKKRKKEITDIST